MLLAQFRSYLSERWNHPVFPAVAASMTLLGKNQDISTARLGLAEFLMQQPAASAAAPSLRDPAGPNVDMLDGLGLDHHGKP